MFELVVPTVRVPLARSSRGIGHMEAERPVGSAE